MARVVLDRLFLSHFRSYTAARLAFDGRPVAIWGQNGAGKTNILEAISLLSPGRGMRGAGAEDIARRPDAAGWKLRAQVTGPDGPREVETWAEGAARQVRLDGKAVAQSALGSVLRVLWLTPAMDRLWTEPAEGRRRFLDRLTLSFLPGHAEAALGYEKAMRQRNRLLRDGVLDPAWFAALETRMAQTGALIVANRAAALARIAAAQEAVDGVFPAADLSLLMPADAGAAADDLAVVLAEGRRRDMAAGRTLAGPHRADLAAVWRAKGVPASVCSTGEQKALLISLILANARALAADGGVSVLLLDEVAAHLDAGRRAALFDAVCSLGAQAFMTGTGPELFAEMSGRAQGLTVAEEGGASQVQAGAI